MRRAGRPVLLSKKDSEEFRGLQLTALTPAGKGPFSAFRIRVAPRSHFPEILHRRTAEFFLVLKGSGYGKVGRRDVRFKAGDHVYLPAGTTHDFHTGARSMEALVIFAPRFDVKRPDVVRV